MKINLPLTFCIIFVTFSAFLNVTNGAPQASEYGMHQENQPCFNDTDCNDDYEAYTCDLSDKCVCDSFDGSMTYVKDLHAYTCLLIVGLQEACVYDEQCKNNYNAECSNGECLCKKGYYYSIRSFGCELGMVNFGDPCEVDEQCPSEAYCDETCHCPVRLYEGSGGCYYIWNIGNKTALISGVAFVIIVLAAIIGYFGYQRMEKEKIKKQELEASVSGMKTTNMTEYGNEKQVVAEYSNETKDFDSKRLL